MAVFTAIGASLFGAGTFLAGVTAGGLQIAAGIALNYISQSLSGSSRSEQPRSGVQGKLQAGGDLGREFPFGLAATAGSIVYANYWGLEDKSPNAYFTQVIAVSDLPVNSLAQVWVNGKLCNLSASAHASYGYPVLEYREDGVDYLWIKFYDGTQTTADSFLTGTVSSAERPYGSTRKGIGVAYVIATSLVNEELFNKQYPTFKFALNGLKLYDVSKDTTRGGDGSHRLDTPSTWGGDGDHLPIVQLHAILRGITLDGEWVYGLQNTSISQLPDAWWISQIEKCRDTVTGPDGSEASYRSGGFIRVGTQVNETAQAILATCQGRIAEIGGFYKPHVGAPGESVASFTDEQIITTVEQRFTPFLPLSDTITGIAATSPSPSEGWVSRVAPPLYRTDLDTVAGSRRLMADVSLDLCPYPGQVQRVMKSALEEAQRARRHTFVLPPEYWTIEPGDVVTWTSAYNGYDAKLFRIDGIVDMANLDVMVDITEVSQDDYAWDQEEDYRTPTSGGVALARPAPQVATGFQALPATIFDADGVGRRPTIEIRIDDDLHDIRDVHVQIRLKASGALIFSERIPYVFGNGVIILDAVFLKSTEYEARAKLNPFGTRKTYWSNQDSEGVDGDWITVTTRNIGFSESDFSDDVASALNDLYTGIRDLQEYVHALDITQTESASYSRDVVAKIDGSLAIVRRQSEALAGIDFATATDLTAVYAEIGEVSASGLWKVEAVVGAVDGYSRVTLAAKADGEASAVSMFALDAKSTGESRAFLTTDEFGINDLDGNLFFYVNRSGLFFVGAAEE